MRIRNVVAIVAAVLSTQIAAQDNEKAVPTIVWRMPYEPSFWHYIAATAGHSAYDLDCVPGASFPCNERDASAFKLAVGGNFNGMLGLEIGYVNLGNVDINAIGPGNTNAQGANLSIVARTPPLSGVSLSGRLGTTYGWTRNQVRILDNTCALGLAPESSCKQSHSERGFGLSYGAGLSVGIAPNVDVRLDWDRYRFQFSQLNSFQLNGGERDIDMWSLGFNVSF
jgi:OOP family OmpA-OmpF porin